MQFLIIIQISNICDILVFIRNLQARERLILYKTTIEGLYKETREKNIFALIDQSTGCDVVKKLGWEPVGDATLRHVLSPIVYDTVRDSFCN